MGVQDACGMSGWRHHADARRHPLILAVHSVDIALHNRAAGADGGDGAARRHPRIMHNRADGARRVRRTQTERGIAQRTDPGHGTM